MNEDEGKEGRYFPTESEISTLAKYIQIYFSHPERSVQRSQVVQQVVGILAPQNPHWDQRKIRLWFNNNKKIYYKGLSEQDVIIQKDPSRIQYSPAKKYMRHHDHIQFLSFHQKNIFLIEHIQHLDLHHLLLTKLIYKFKHMNLH